MRRPLHGLVFLLTAICSLALTFGAWLAARSDVEADARAQFDVQVAEIVAAIKGRALDYEQVLRGAAGLFAASERVERRAWDAYVDTLRIETVYPGMRGLGYAPIVRGADREQFEAQARSEGIERYAISPPGPRPAYVPLLYLRPLDARGRRALGRDLYADPARRQALERARDTGTAAVTRALTLWTNPEGDAEKGAIMYLPVYRNGARAESVPERRAALAGFVYVPFRYAEVTTGGAGRSPAPAPAARCRSRPRAPAATRPRVARRAARRGSRRSARSAAARGAPRRRRSDRARLARPRR